MLRNGRGAVLLAIILSMLTGRSAGQEMLGITNCTYSGVHGALLNPSTPVLSPYYLDINLVSANIFIENNYIYLAKEEYKFQRFFSKNPDFPAHPPDGKFYYDYYTPSNKYGYIDARLMGPSAVLVMGKHAFGFFSNVRSVTSIQKIPYNLAKFFFEGLTYPPQYDKRFVHDKRISLSSLTWGELALNYSYLFRHSGNEYWSLGLSLKNLQGYAGAYATTTLMDYMVPDHDTLYVYHATGEGGISLPLDYQTNDFIKSPTFRGKGFGIDIGITYERKKSGIDNADDFQRLCSQSYEPYLFRIGISILDIGRIRFKENAMKFEVQDGSLNWPGISDYEFLNMNDVTSQVSNHFFGNPTQLIVDDEIVIGLPTTLNATADLNITGNFFANGIFVLPFRLMRPSVMSPNLLSLGARYETALMDFGITSTLYNGKRLALGAHGRLFCFFFGTEKIGSFFHMTDFTGIDIYAGIKLSFRKGKCRLKTGYSCGNNEYQKYKKVTNDKRFKSRW